jgi:hypothetical protein
MTNLDVSFGSQILIIAIKKSWLFPTTLPLTEWAGRGRMLFVLQSSLDLVTPGEKSLNRDFSVDDGRCCLVQCQGSRTGP